MRSIALLLAGVAVAGEPVDPPAFAPEQALAFMALPKPGRALEHLDAVVGRFQPGLRLRLILGGILGDPGIKTLRDDAPIVFAWVGVPQSAPSLAVYVPVHDGTAIAAAMQRFGFAAQVRDDLVIAVRDPAAQVAAGELAPAWQAYARLAPTVNADLVYGLRPRAALAAWDAQLREATEQIASVSAQQPGMAALMRTYVAGLRHLGGQMGSLQAGITFSADAATCELRYAAVPGTPLAAMLTRTAFDAAEAWAALPPTPQPPTIGLAGAMDGKAIGNLVEDLLTTIRADPAVGAALGEADARATVAMIRALQGPFASRMGVDSAGALRNEGSVGFVPGSDVPGLLDAMLAPGSGIDRLYRGMGIQLSLLRDQRRVAGSPVHRLRMDLDDAVLNHQQIVAMRTWAHDVEMATVGDRLLQANDPALLDALIARARTPGAAGAPLRAVARHGPGRAGYGDYDVLALMAAVMKQALDAAPNAAFPRALAQLPPGEPITFAWQSDAGRGRTWIHIPIGPFAALREAVERAQREPAQKTNEF